MATNDMTGQGDEAVEGSWSPKRTKASAEKKGDKPAPDPEVLAGEIEKTREELAETLDAIADKVSPKRVADRTKKKVGDAVKEGAATVKAGAGQLKDTVADKAADAKDAAAGATAAAGTGSLGDALEGVGQDPGAPVTSTSSLRTPSAGLHPVPPPSAQSGPALGPPALAGAAAALLVALLVLRRRRSRPRRRR